MLATRRRKCHTIFFAVYPSYFKLPARWLSSLTQDTYFGKLPGIRCVAAFMQLELFRVKTEQ
ncbi:MAG TPA: hypothetical protein DEF84_19025 [Leclercia adecarboxylata]|nr:hypothetical protein [Leclercia adecarboxylata]HCQ09323.1 hypothetical protein [Leclercia adecarboxylata]